MTKKVAVINDQSGLGRCSLIPPTISNIICNESGLSAPYRPFKFADDLPSYFRVTDLYR